MEAASQMGLKAHGGEGMIPKDDFCLFFLYLVFFYN
jgi:hypothetical protein